MHFTECMLNSSNFLKLHHGSLFMSTKWMHNIIFMTDAPFKWPPLSTKPAPRSIWRFWNWWQISTAYAPARLALLDPLSSLHLWLPPHTRVLSYFSDWPALLPFLSLQPILGRGWGREDLTCSIFPGCQNYRIISFLEISNWIFMGCTNLPGRNPMALKWGHWVMSRHSWLTYRGTLLASRE